MADQQQAASRTPQRLDELAPMIRQAQGFRLPVYLIGTVAVLVVLMGLIWGAPLKTPSIAGIIILELLTIIVLAAVAIALHLRTAVTREVTLAEEQAKRREGEDEKQSLFSSAVEEEPKTDQAIRRLTFYGRNLQSVLLALGAVGSGFLAVMAILRTTAGDFDSTRLFALAFILFIVAFAHLVAARWFQSQSEQSLPEGKPLSNILRSGQWSAVVAAIGLLIHALNVPAGDIWAGWLLFFLVIFISLELLVRSVASFLGRRQRWDRIQLPIALVVAESLFSGMNPVASALDILERRFGMTVRSSWVLRFVRRALPPVAAGMVLIFWSMSCLIAIAPEEQGIKTRFGALVSEQPLEPGLHLKLPWPIERIDKIPTRQVHEMMLGRAEDSPESPYIIWSKIHAEGEEKLVLGEGRELVSLEIKVQYVINNPRQYLLSHQNPDDAFRALAYRTLTREIVGENLDTILTTKRADFPETLREIIQKQVDEHELGIGITVVAVQGLHPPVDVATDYEAVISAQVEQVTLVTRARAERASEVPTAEGARDAAVKNAQAEAAVRLAEAKGEALRFRSVENAYKAAPDLFRHRRLLETMEEVLPDKRVYIVDETLSGQGELWVDMREGAATP